MPSRQFLILVHRYVGLGLGLIIVAVGLTGAILVYQSEIEVALNPELHHVATGPRPKSYEAIIRAAFSAHPDRDTLVALGPNDGRPGRSYWVMLGTSGQPHIRVAVDPYRAEVLGVIPGRSWLTTVRRLHTNLLLGGPGKLVLGLASIALVATLIAGALLWWSSRASVWRLLLIRWNLGARAAVHDLHAVGGALALPFTLVLTLSGATLLFGQEVRAVLDLLGGAETPTTLESARPTQGAPLTLDDAVRALRVARPGVAIRSISPPRDETGVYSFYIMSKGRSPFSGIRSLTIDQYTGELVHDSYASNPSALRRWLDFWFPTIHAGTILGRPTEVLTMVVGVVLVWLAGSGTFMWYRKSAVLRPPSDEIAERGRR